MIADLGTITSKLFERWGWKCIPPLVVCWVALWPVGLAWLALSLAGAYRDRDRSSEARVERRVARLLSLYPPRWQSRYGQEFAELRRETIRSGHGGPHLTLNVVREGTAAWWQSREGRRALLPATCWWMCWIPLGSQGLAPLIMKAGPTAPGSPPSTFPAPCSGRPSRSCSSPDPQCWAWPYAECPHSARAGKRVRRCRGQDGQARHGAVQRGPRISGHAKPAPARRPGYAARASGGEWLCRTCPLQVELCARGYDITSLRRRDDTSPAGFPGGA